MAETEAMRAKEAELLSTSELSKMKQEKNKDIYDLRLQLAQRETELSRREGELARRREASQQREEEQARLRAARARSPPHAQQGSMSRAARDKAREAIHAQRELQGYQARSGSMLPRSESPAAQGAYLDSSAPRSPNPMRDAEQVLDRMLAASDSTSSPPKAGKRDTRSSVTGRSAEGLLPVPGSAASKVFEGMDVNWDGVVDRDEFRAAVDRGDLQQLVPGPAGRPPPLRSLVDRLDRVIREHDLGGGLRRRV